MQSPVQPVILCGGAGTRLWPESRGERAKQFLHLADPALSLLQQTVRRGQNISGCSKPLFLCGPAHVGQVTQQCAALDVTPHFMVEPMARNTAPAIALAALASDGDALLLVMPSDHVVADEAAFSRAVCAAVPLAQDDWLITFGITPDRPETGFGYIERGDPLSEHGYRVSRFVEKPDAPNAQAMINTGNFSWNAGIFLFRASAMLAAMAQHCPDVLAAAKGAVKRASGPIGVRYVDAESFARSPSVAIDVAVMERTDRVAVVPVEMGWSDIGSWNAVHALAPHDTNGNAITGDVRMIDSHNCLIRADNKRVSLLGLSGLAVIVDGNDIVIVPLDRSQDVKLLAEERQK